MAYLESRNVVHRDLAARNVLIHEDGTAKVTTHCFAEFYPIHCSFFDSLVAKASD